MFELSILLGVYFTLSSLYMLIFAVAAKIASFNQKKEQHVSFKKEHSIAVFIPAYKEDNVILEVAKQAVNHDYKEQDVFIIADSLKPATLSALRELPLTVVEVHFEKSTKAKALNFALDMVKKNAAKQYDIAVVLDADNIMQAGFLSKISNAYSQGFLVVQGRRIAKNLDSSFAILDGLSEAINNNIYNLGQVKLGFSARLVGSGMAFDYALFEALMKSVDAIGGFDKELELKLLEQGNSIHYLSEAVVLDEKVSKASVFGKQRLRWISAQFFYLKLYGWTAFKALVTKGNVDFFNKALQMALPPRLLLSAFLILGFISHCFVGTQLLALWGLGLAANVIANVVALPRSMYTLKTFFALCQLPVAILVMLVALVKLPGANNKFIHTPHG